MSAAPRSHHVEAILTIVAEEFGCSVGDILGPSKFAELVAPRYTAIAAIQQILGHGLSQIGREIGGRDHTTIMNALARYPHIQSSYPVETDAVMHRATQIVRRETPQDGDPVWDWCPSRDVGRAYLWANRVVRATVWHAILQRVGVTYTGPDGRQRGALVAPEDLRHAISAQEVSA